MVWKYIGEDKYVVGIPARHLTDYEVEQIGEDFVKESGCYIQSGTEGDDIESVARPADTEE